MTPLEPYEFRDPAALMAELAERITLDEGSVHLVLVERPSTVQRLVRVDRLRSPAELLSPEEAERAEDEMRDVIERWPLPEARPPNHSWVRVIVRSGWCVFGPNEGQWFAAERYLNHLQPLYSGTTILVTEHGWVDFMTYAAGRTPAMLPAA